MGVDVDLDVEKSAKIICELPSKEDWESNGSMGFDPVTDPEQILRRVQNK